MNNSERMKVWRQAKTITDRIYREGRSRPTPAEHAELEELFSRIDELDSGATARSSYAHLVRPEPHTGGTDMTSPSTFAELLNRTGTLTAHYVDRETRALSLGTASAGGNTAPKGFVNELWRHLELASPVPMVARVFTTPDEAELLVPTLATWGSAAAVAEGSALPGTDPTFTQLTLRAHRYSQLVKVSNTLLNSEAVNLDGFMAEVFARNIDAVTGPLVAFGTGTTQPQGYAHAAGSAVVGGTAVAGAFTYDNLVNMLSHLDSGYQANAVWLLSPSAVGTLRKLKDDSERPLWQPSMALGEPATLLGRPVYVDRHLGAVATGGTSVVVMDPNAYAIRYGGGGIRVDRSDDAFFSTDEVGFRAVAAMDAAYLDTAAAVRFVGGSV